MISYIILTLVRMNNGYNKMSKKKRACVIVQGISEKRRYMKTSSKVVNGYIDKYDKDEYIDTESIFDRGWFSKLFDKWDFIPYFLNGARRKAVCRIVNKTIVDLHNDGYEVDVIAHSLGCVIALQSGRKKFKVNINNLICLQPPTNNKVYGWYVRRKVKQFSDYIKVNNLRITWNPGDEKVASKELDTKKFRKGFKGVIKDIKQFKVGNGHNWLAPLKALIVRGKI